jgi:electron transfer flavoprotein alpha subunit
MSDVLAVAEHRQGDLRAVTGEVVAAGRQLADGTGGDLAVLLVGGAEHADAVAREGVDRVLHAPHEGPFDHGVHLAAIAAAREELDDPTILAGHTAASYDFAAAVAEREGLAFASDVVDLAPADGGLRVTRELYASKVESTVAVPTPAVVTVRSGEWEAAPPGGDPSREDLAVGDAASGATVTGYETVETEVDLGDADFIVAVGRGIGEEENLDLVRELCDASGATLAASRPIVDNGWLPPDRQVGQSGQTVAPDVYLAVGISGAVQHVAGMKKADTIVAVNTDPDAPIFDVADVGVVGDLFDVVPALVEELG